jgi:phosphoribosylglycinamide formyltransferase-1
MTKPLRVAALASGRGSNLAALIAARDRGEPPIEFVLVGSDKAHAGALEIAREAGIPTLFLNPRDYPDRRSYDLALFERVAASGAELLILAGFMRIVDEAAIAPWAGRAINIHPSLLPKYRGLHTHRRALEAKDAEHGASVHYVTAELDGGPVIAHRRIAVLADDSEQSLAERLLPEEHRLLPAVVAAIAAGRLTLTDGRPCFDGQPLAAPLWMDDRGNLVA